jgi:hypothetical protein
MDVKTSLRIDGLAKFFQEASEPGVQILLYNVETRDLSCGRCNESGSNGDTIKHKSCCPYAGGDGCFGKP